MATFTSSLPDDLLESLRKKADQVSVPMNRIIEKAVRVYLDQLNRAEYVKSYSEAAEDKDIMVIAEEGMADYLKELPE